MLRFTLDNREVIWDDGLLTGDRDLVRAVTAAVEQGVSVSYDFWAERPASVATEWDAYLTIGFVLDTLGVPAVDRKPTNPDGYMPEGVYEDDEQPSSAPIVAAANRYLDR